MLTLWNFLAPNAQLWPFSCEQAMAGRMAIAFAVPDMWRDDILVSLSLDNRVSQILRFHINKAIELVDF